MYVIYCRKSEGDEGRQVQSIPDQIKRCMEYVEANNIEVLPKPKNFAEEFETDKDRRRESNAPAYERKIYETTKDLFIIKETRSAMKPGRPKRKKLIKLVERGKVKGLLSYSPDRQARNILEGGELINLVDEDKVYLRYTNFQFENTASGKMMLGVWFVFAKQYSDGIQENVIRGNTETINRGKGLGAIKRGYRRIQEGEENDQGQTLLEGYYMPDHNRLLMKEAFRLKIYEDKTDRYIVERLNKRGFNYKYGKATKKAGTQGLGRRRRDSFNYGLLCAGENQNDQTISNPYFKPLITKEEFYYLQDKLLKSQGGQPYQKSKKENEDLEIVPKQFIFGPKKGLLSFGIPSKRRYKEKLNTLKKTKEDATLKDVIQPKHIEYRVGSKKSPDYGVSIKGHEITKAIIKKLENLHISKEQYQAYLGYMKANLKKINKENGEFRRQLTRNINHRKEQRSKFITENSHLKLGDEIEQQIYHEKRRELENKIERAEEEYESVGNKEDNKIIELECFIEIMSNAVEYYKKASFVQKRKITEIFFSNITVTKQKRLTLAVKPIFVQLFKKKKSSGAEYEIRTRDLHLGKVAL